MSDDDSDGGAYANIGITLPTNPSATHSITLSPLFFQPNGRGSSQAEDDTLLFRGKSGFHWSMTANTTSNNLRYAWYLVFNDGDKNIVQPNDRWTKTAATSLRCLVSQSQASE